MPATFTTTINAIRTTSESGLERVAKRVEFTITGTQDGQTVSLPFAVTLSSPDPENFTPYKDLSEAQVLAWVEAEFTNMQPMKDHIQAILNHEILMHGMDARPLPWMPVTPNQ